jgi:hypothetical protein
MAESIYAPQIFPATPDSDRRGKAMAEKRIHYRIDPNDESVTLKDIMKLIQDIQRQHPDLDVFFDGDEYAVCSRPKKSKT